MKKQIIKLKSELMDNVENNDKRATTRLGLKPYHLGPVVFQNSEVPLDILDKNYEINKIEALAFCDLTDKLAIMEGYENVSRLRQALVFTYGPIDDYATCTVVYFNQQ